MVNLTDVGTERVLGFSPNDFTCARKDMKARGQTPPTWTIVDGLLKENIHAIRVPSAAAPGGINLVIYKLDGSPGKVVRAVDPDKALPVDQASWPPVLGPYL